MTSARNRFPLDPNEERALMTNLLATQAMMLALGVLGSMAVAALALGQVGPAIFGFGWARGIAGALIAQPASLVMGAGVALAVVFLLTAALFEWSATRSEAGRAAVLEARRGLNGELARLPLPHLTALLALTGITEELLFRYALIGVIAGVVSLALPSSAAAMVALALSSLAFWLTHTRYRDFWSSATVLALSFVLGAVYLVTGSLALVALAHFLYDLGAVLHERWRIAHHPDPFNGPAPRRVLLDLIEARQAVSANGARDAGGESNGDADGGDASAENNEGNANDENAADAARNTGNDDEERR